MFRNLLVHIPSERPVRPVVDLSISLAYDLKAHVDAVTIGFESLSSVGAVGDVGAAAAAVMDLERDRALERANAAVAVFETEARLADIAYGTRALTGFPIEAAETMGELARLYDLAIVLQPDSSSNSHDNIIPLEVLFNSGGPMLMVPYIHKGPFKPRHVGIAWDGSRLAARAVRDAMPFLTAARAVTVISVNEENVATEFSSAELLVHLARRGIRPKVERLTSDRSYVHSTILSIAADSGIDLLVMGGYGHSRLKERILGGVTRGMFESMTVPTLMSH